MYYLTTIFNIQAIILLHLVDVCHKGIMKHSVDVAFKYLSILKCDTNTLYRFFRSFS